MQAYWQAPFLPNLLNSVVFLVETSQMISVFFANYKGRPWMKVMSIRSDGMMMMMMMMQVMAMKKKRRRRRMMTTLMMMIRMMIVLLQFTLIIISSYIFISLGYARESPSLPFSLCMHCWCSSSSMGISTTIE